jgi:arabinose-5-phosphate isomerase
MINNLRKLGLAVVDTEMQAIAALSERIDENFVIACKYMLACKGRVIVTGMGKSGHIAGKIAATLASTGTPAFFVHPGEASHGDLGMITSNDVVLALSNSGETTEILFILPIIKRLGIPFISLTGNIKSTLAENATINIDVSVAKEACPLGLAPTASTTAALVMGDALAVALLESRGFDANDFARSHPGGRLGKRLLLHVADIMHVDKEIPQVITQSNLKSSLLEMNTKGLGITAIIDNNNQVLGIFTDGDLRRIFAIHDNINDIIIDDIMHINPKVITKDMLAIDALTIMQENKITGLLVVSNDKTLIGILHMHDLLRAGVV